MPKPKTDWTPIVEMDFFNADARLFNSIRAQFIEKTKASPRDPSVTLPDGWHTITPDMAEELLKRNTRNRPVDWNFVLAYGTQMHNRRWKKTGEPVIINGNGDVDDAGHRLWACYLSGASFPTYVVNVETDPDLFAFIDNGKSRNGSDTLTTAGIGPQSTLIARIVRDIAIPFDEHSLSYIGRVPRAPCTNIDVLDYVRANPEMVETIRVIREIYPAAIKRIGVEAVGAFVGWKIQSLYGSGILEDFFGGLVRIDLGPTNPIAVFQKRLDEHLAAQNAPRNSPKRKMALTPNKILALTIRAFNLWKAKQTVRRIDPRADDAFPDFETIEVEKEAA